MIVTKQKIISIFLAVILFITTILMFFYIPKEVSADGAMSGTSWGSGSSGNIILTKQTVLRVGFDKRQQGAYRDFGYINCYPSMYKGYSIILGTCGNTYSGSSYTNNVVLAPTSDNTGRIDYSKAENMILSRPSEAGLYQAIWDMIMGGTSSYTGDGVTALKNGKTINLDSSLGKELAEEIRSLSGSDWNGAKFYDDVDWTIPLNQNAKMKDNAMAMVLIATYLNWRGADYDLKEIYNYYTRQGASNDYILVLENFHGAMRSSDKQPFFTHQNYIFDAVTGYHVHNSMRAGTLDDWFKSIKDSQVQPINATYSGPNLMELYASGNGSNPTRQLFCHFFASKGGKLVGNRMALSAYFYRDALPNGDLSEETKAALSKDDPNLYWYTKQYSPHSDLGDSWANDFTRYKTGFAVFKAVPPVQEISQKPSAEKPKGGHTLSVTPASQEVERFTKLSENAEIVKTDITLTPTDDDLTSLSETIYGLLFNWTTFENGKFTIIDQPYNAGFLGDRRVTLQRASWSIDFDGKEITESKSGDNTVEDNQISGITMLGKELSNGKVKSFDLVIKKSEVVGESEADKVNYIKTRLAQMLSGYSLSKYVKSKHITNHDGKFDSVGTFIWDFNSKLTVNIAVEDKFEILCEGGKLEDYDKIEKISYKYIDENKGIITGESNVELIGIDKDILYSDWTNAMSVQSGASDSIKLSSGGLYSVDFGESKASASFNVIEAKTKTFRWRNNPKAYAEIKQGIYSDNRSTESWEAMQGMPTTEPLYINIGGTPYYIDIIADYKTAEFSKDFEMPYTTTSHSTEDGSVVHKTSETYYDTASKKFSAGYFVINNITLRPCDKAVIMPNKDLFENGEAIEVEFMNNLTAKAVIDSQSGNYYTDNYGDNESLYSYGITDVPESILKKEFSKFSQSCTKCSSDTEKHKEHFESELNRLNVFVNSPGVTLEVYNNGKLVNSLEILKGYTYSGSLLEAETDKLRAGTELWQPLGWENEYDIIQPLGYTGQPNLENGRNRNNEFYGVSSLNMKLQALNGRYEFPKTAANADYEAEIEAGYESVKDKFVTFMNLGEAQEYGPGICINNTSIPDKYPVPINYTDDLLYANEPEGINPLIVHNPISIQDVSIGTSKLTEQRVNTDNPLGKEGAVTRIDIDDYFNVYTPVDGAFVRNYSNSGSNAGSSNSNHSEALKRGLLVTEMYNVKQSGTEGFKIAENGALGRGFNGVTSDIENIIPSIKGIRTGSGSYMNTVKWTAHKFIQFPFDVNVKSNENCEYIPSETWISIPVSNTETQFIVSGNQKDVKEAKVKFVAISNNAPDINIFKDKIDKNVVLPIKDTNISAKITEDYGKAVSSVNYIRDNNNTANHYVKNSFVVDVVGRIGNFTVDYCEGATRC